MTPEVLLSGLTFTVLQELDALVQYVVSQHDHVLGHVLDERQEATFRVEPRVGAEFLLVRLQALDHAGDAKFVVAFGAVESAARESEILPRVCYNVSPATGQKAKCLCAIMCVTVVMIW